MGDFMRYLQGGSSGFQPYAAGNKIYGGGRPMPNLGPVTDTQGYVERDLRLKTLRENMLKRMQASQQGRFMSPEYLDPANRSY